MKMLYITGEDLHHNGARPYLRVRFHFVDHRPAKIYGNQKSPQYNKQHAVDFPFFFGGDFMIAIQKDTCTSVDWKNNQLNFSQGEPHCSLIYGRMVFLRASADRRTSESMDYGCQMKVEVH